MDLPEGLLPGGAPISMEYIVGHRRSDNILPYVHFRLRKSVILHIRMFSTYPIISRFASPAFMTLENL